MKCEVIRDLLPLYVDGCVSEESKALVEEHLNICKECRAICDEMREEIPESEALPPLKKNSKVQLFKASVLQSVLLFVSFALIVLGVTFESVTPLGADNGMWAFALIVPVTGFMLSLANWYFVKIYSSKKVFALFSMIITFLFIAAGYTWGYFHYGAGVLSVSLPYILSVALSAVLVASSYILSRVYARLVGKE